METIVNYIRNAAKKQLNVKIPKGQTLYEIGDAGDGFIEVRGVEMDKDGNLTEVSLGRFPDPFNNSNVDSPELGFFGKEVANLAKRPS